MRFYLLHPGFFCDIKLAEKTYDFFFLAMYASIYYMRVFFCDIKPFESK